MLNEERTMSIYPYALIARARAVIVQHSGPSCLRRCRASIHVARVVSEPAAELANGTIARQRVQTKTVSL